MLIRVRFDGKTTTLDYDPSLGIDTLMAQLISINNNDENIVLVDFGGYEITNHDDIEDIKVVEISDANVNVNDNGYNRMYAASNDETSNISLNSHNNYSNTNITNNNDIDDWAQHLDLTSNHNNISNNTAPISNTINNTISANSTTNITMSANDNMTVDSSTNDSLYNQSHIDAIKDVSYGQSLVRLVAIADVWVVPNNDYCTTIINSHKNSGDIDLNEIIADDDEIIQPCYRIADTNINICSRCTSFFDPSLITKETNMLWSFSCNSRKALKLGLGLFPNSIDILTKENTSTSYDVNPSNIYLRRKLLNHAINLLPNPVINENYDDAFYSNDFKKFVKQLKKGSELVHRYEDATQQKLARSVIDYDLVNYYAQEFLEKNKDPQSTKNEEDVALLAGLLRWFKSDFFKWCNKPECTNNECLSCGSQKDMESLRTEEPNEEELLTGQAGRTEVYKCKSCNHIERFPRFTDPGHLLTTRRGRCGEWASAFCLICRSLNLDARWVLDFTDHVWVEVWLPSLRRFVHADPCENKFDTPLLYESGWNKNLEYILSFSRYGVVDSTPKYTRKLNQVITKRSLTLNEKFVQDSIKKMDRELEMTFSASRRNSAVSNSSLINLQVLSSGEKGFESLANNDISIMTMKRRKRLLSKELVRLTLLGKPGLKEEEFEGRISGSKEWKMERGENGKVSIPTNIDSSMMIFPVVDSRSFLSSEVAVTAEVNIFGLGLGAALDDQAIQQCKQLATSLIKLGWFNFTSTFILDPLTGRLTSNTSKPISSSFYYSPDERQSTILRIFESDLKNDSYDKLIFLLKKEKLVVFHCNAFNNNAFDQDNICNLLFGGYLSRSKFVITVGSQENEDAVVMKYIPLGGCVHEDTSSFDTTAFLSPLIDYLVTNADNVDANGTLLSWKNLNLNQVSLLSSSSLANGLQVQYSLPFASTSSTMLDALSPLFASYNDNPTLQTLNLKQDTEKCQIEKVNVRCGALIDKVEFVMNNDSIFSGGGDGGDSKTFQIPEGWELIGFFGGTGGHLHNIGIIIKLITAKTPKAILSSLRGTIFSANTIMDMMTKYNLYSHRYFNTGMLLKIINTIFHHNEAAVRRKALSACAAYAANITSNTMSFRTVNKENKFFKRTIVGANGALDLFLFTPVGFSLKNNHYTNTVTTDMLWLQNYSNFLYELSLL